MSSEQVEAVSRSFITFCLLNGPASLNHRNMQKYLKFPISASLPKHFTSLDASRPWLVYWVLSAINIVSDFDGFPKDTEFLSVVNTHRATSQILMYENSEYGGFGGGYGQIPHLASTFASVVAIICSGDVEALNKIDRKKLYEFFLSLKNPDGSFSVHDLGESDIRATYCLIAVASLLNILTPDLLINTKEYIVNCQTFEGGLGGCPGLEAHGGYAYCGLAALFIIQCFENWCDYKDSKCGQSSQSSQSVRKLDLKKLSRWLMQRQGAGGGFSGRSNKLVDGCYSFWVGACVSILEMFQSVLRQLECKDADDVFVEVCSKEMVQEYTVKCCQTPLGGFRDRPDKNRGPDYYHTCYCLAGLSVSQFEYKYDLETKRTSGVFKPTKYFEKQELKIIDPVYGVPIDLLEKVFELE